MKGPDRSKWKTDVSAFSKVRYKNLYPGIDFELYEVAGQIKYDLILQPNADLNRVVFNLEGADSLCLGRDGGLTFGTALGELKQGHPVSYEDDAPETENMRDCSFVTLGTTRFGFFAPYRNTTRRFVIDPPLLFGTYLGGSGSSPDEAHAVAEDSAGNVYVTGSTYSSNFPTTPGAYDTNYSTATHDVFVTKLGASGSTLIYSTYIGDSGTDKGWGIALSSSGEAIVVGESGGGFPTTDGAYHASSSGFVLKLNSAGNDLSYSTGIVGQCFSVAVDSSGNAYVAGQTNSSFFETTSGAFDTTRHTGMNAFVLKLNSSGTGLSYSTFLGNQSANTDDDVWGIAINSSGEAFVTGLTTSGSFFPGGTSGYDTSLSGSNDIFVAKLNSTGTSLSYGTYLGGTGAEGPGQIGRNRIAVDSSGRAYITGRTTSSSGFPLASAYDSSLGGASDAFLIRLSAAGTGLDYGTYLGGGDNDEGCGMVCDNNEVAYIVGVTSSNSGFPLTSGTGLAYQETHGGGTDAFIIKFDTSTTASIRLKYGSYLGGSNGDYGLGIAKKSSETGNVVVAGLTYSSSFLSGGEPFDSSYDSNGDAFVAQLALSVIYVDRTFSGTERGTSSQPYNTLAEGISAVESGGLIVIKKDATAYSAPSYPYTISQSVTLVATGSSGVVTIQ